MATASKPTRTHPNRATRGREPRHPLREVCHYLVAIEEWDWSLSFGINDPRRRADLVARSQARTKGLAGRAADRRGVAVPQPEPRPPAPGLAVAAG